MTFYCYKACAIACITVYLIPLKGLCPAVFLLLTLNGLIAMIMVMSAIQVNNHG